MPAAREASEGDVGLFTLLHSMVLPHIPSLSAFPLSLPHHPGAALCTKWAQSRSRDCQVLLHFHKEDSRVSAGAD